MKGLLQAGEGQGDNAGVKLAHEGAGAHRGHDEPMSMPVVGHHRGPAGLDEQPLPPAVGHPDPGLRQRRPVVRGPLRQPHIPIVRPRLLEVEYRYLFGAI